MTENQFFLYALLDGSLEIIIGFYFFTRFLHKRVKLFHYLLFAAAGTGLLRLVPSGTIAEFAVYVVFLAVAGIFICRAEGSISLLYAVITAEIMQLCYGISNSLLPLLYPLFFPFHPETTGIIFMLSGGILALCSSILCYRALVRNFSLKEALCAPYMLLFLLPTLMIFFIGQYIHFAVYGNTTTSLEPTPTHFQMLFIQLLALLSLFCILYASQKLAENFRLGTQLALQKQEADFLHRYVEEARLRYEKTKAFRHDAKNHVLVVKKLLENNHTAQALNYLQEMERLTDDMSFSCTTGNPAADILLGSKLGIAESMGIDVSCSLILPYPCPVSDIDFCIILSNALDNALHACMAPDAPARKYICVTGRRQGALLLLEVENSYQGSPCFQEGTGLSNIRAAAQKYNGSVRLETTAAAFIVSVLLVIPQQ